MIKKREVKAISKLGGDNWLEIISTEYSDGTMYTHSHEIRCNGDIVVVLPYMINKDGSMSYLLRNELTPCWSITEHKLSCITGGVDNGSTPLESAIKELSEESGYETRDLNFMGVTNSTKSSDTVYHYYCVDVTNLTITNTKGTNENFEDEAYNEWVNKGDYLKLMTIDCPITNSILYKHNL